MDWQFFPVLWEPSENAYTPSMLRSSLRLLRRLSGVTGAEERAWNSWSARHPSVAAIITRVRESGWTYLDLQALMDLAQAAMDAERKNLPGIIIETGCGRGGSSIVLAAAKQPARPLVIYDTFSGIPPPGRGDGWDARLRFWMITHGRARGSATEVYYGYLPELRQKVEQSFAACGLPVADHQVRLIEGRLEDTLQGSELVALAHIDCDWYEPVRASLERIAPRLCPGGRMILDDAYMWSGCRRAVREFLQMAEQGAFTVEHHARLHLVRTNGR